MKKIGSIEKIVLTAAIGTLLSGCSYLKNKHPLLTATPTITVVTNTVVQLVTNEVTKPVYLTNTVTQQLPGQPPIIITRVETNLVTVPQIVQVPVQVPVYITNWNYAVSAGATSALNAAEGIAPLVPQPIGGILSLLAGLGGAGLGLYAKLMSGKYRQVISAVAAGVETGADSLTKTAIQNAAAGAGVQHLLDPIVQEVTRKMADAPDTAPAVPAKA